MAASLSERASEAEPVLVLGVFAALPTVGLVNGPAYAPLLFGLAGLRLIIARGRVTADQTLNGIGAAFVVLCWASCLWSIVPSHSAAGAAQVTGVLVWSLLMVQERPAPPRLAPVMAWAVVAGAAVMVADRITGNHLLHLVSTHVGATKYNRGIDYLVLLLMPLLCGLMQQGRRRLGLAVYVATIACVAAGQSTTAWVALPAALLVLAIARRATRLVARALGAAVLLGAPTLPFALRWLSGLRGTLAPHIKSSMLHRLEIWDYVSARVLERPLFGWGIWSSTSLPVTSAELSHYVRDHGESVYPHNQWLELWAETGIIGVALAAGLVLFLLWRVRRMPAAMQPFALACLFVALCISTTSFEVTTDSWWAALAACGLMFRSWGAEEGRQAVRL